MTDTETSARTGPSSWRPWAVLGTLAAAFYLVAYARNRIETDDAFQFAEEVESAPWALLIDGDNVRHLVVLPMFRLLHDLVMWVGVEVRAYELMRVTSSLAAGAAVALLGIVLEKRFQLSRFVAVATASGFGVSYGFWRYANEADVYSFSAFIVLVLVWLSLGERITPLRAVGVGAVAALAIGVHVLSVVPALVFVPFALVYRRDRWFGPLTFYAGTVAVLVGGAYLAAYHYVDPPSRGYMEWVMRAEHPTVYEISGIPKAVVGSSQSLVAGNFAFSFEVIADRIEAALPTRGLDEERFAAERSAPAVRVLAVVTLGMLVITTVVLMIRSRPKLEPTLVAVAIWVLLFTAVALGQQPADPEPWVLLLPPVWILVGVLVFRTAASAGHRSLVVAVVTLLFAHNLVGGFLILGGSDDDLNARKSNFLAATAGPGDFVLTAGLPPFVKYLSYQTKAQVVSVRSIPAEKLDDVYQQVLISADAVYATGDIFDLPDQLPSKEPDAFRRLQEFGRKIRSQFTLVGGDEDNSVYRLS